MDFNLLPMIFISKKILSPYLQGILIAILALNPNLASAETSKDLYITSGNVYFSDESIVHDQAVRIYATISNDTDGDLLGSVQFKNETTGNAIGSDQQVSVLAGKTDTVFVDWRPPAGEYTINITVHPWESEGDDPSNNSMQLVAAVDYDNDGDDIGDKEDPDDDNDGVSDSNDEFPYNADESIDTDGDGLGDNADVDNDNDGVKDTGDAMPQNPAESFDTDEDSVGNNTDTDDDGDGLSDEYETSPTDPETGESKSVTDPLSADTDGDGLGDQEDLFPTDSTETKDTDGDGVGNTTDEDDDNDGIVDSQDAYPENHGPVVEIEQYEEIDPNTGEKYWVANASNSSDPDGDKESLQFKWIGKDGKILSEEDHLRLKFPLEANLMTNLTVVDSQGETRNYAVNLMSSSGIKRAFGLGSLLLLALALIVGLKYTSKAIKAEMKAVPASSKSSKPRKKA